jgi:outer membrane lipoprotein SlyB
MCRKYMLFFLITLAFSQTSCSLHSGSTYDREEMGQPQSFSKGVIISVRNVKIKGTESGVGIVSGAVMGGLAGSQVGSNDATSAIAAIGGALVGGLIGSTAEEMVMKDSAAEFAIQPDIGEPFTFIQENEEELKSGERVLIINSDKMRIIRDQTMKK